MKSITLLHLSTIPSINQNFILLVCCRRPRASPMPAPVDKLATTCLAVVLATRGRRLPSRTARADTSPTTPLPQTSSLALATPHPWHRWSDSPLALTLRPTMSSCLWLGPQCRLQNAKEFGQLKIMKCVFFFSSP